MSKTGTRRRALAVTIAAGLMAAGGLGVALADSAGAATPAASSSATRATQIASTPTQPRLTSPARPSPGSKQSVAQTPTTPTTAAAGVSTSTASSTGPAQQVQLAAAQLPALSAEKWMAVGHPSTRDIAGHDIDENECAKVSGANSWTQQAFSGGDGQNDAIQDTFVFASAGAARSAYQNVAAGMGSCQQTTRTLQSANKVLIDARVTETASRSEADAWQRDWTGVMGMSADGPQVNHVYLAVNGTRLIVLQFTEYPGHAAPYDTAADPQVLAMLATELAE